jgi:murein DD-endopeptidase MepM/ murein hydrolase activator NlpD
MSKIGTHILTGDRNGYGPFCEAKPSVVIAVGEGGALVEAKQKSGGKTKTIYRHNVWPDAPPGIDQTNEAGARLMAEQWFPFLRAQWVLNPADYYTITNEGGGNDLQSLKNFVAYESRTLELAAENGFKCCVLNYAAGQPHFPLWKDIAVPLIIKAWQGRHIYGRHVYGLAHGDLVVSGVLTPFALRPIEEIEHLRGLGHRGGVAITECGLDGGFTYEGQRFLSQMQAYEGVIRNVVEIMGICLWTLGHMWHSANWQNGIPAMINYMNANPTPEWQWPETLPPPPPPGPPPGLHKAIVVKASQEGTRQEWLALADYAYDFRHTMSASHDDTLTVLKGGNSESFVKVSFPTRPSQVETIALIEAEGYRWETIHGFEDQFSLNNPVQGVPMFVTAGGKFNSWRNYNPPFHEGLDLRAVNSVGQAANILAGAPGVVDAMRTTDPGTGYGVYVRVKTVVGTTTYRVWYTHLQYVQPGLVVGSQVETAQTLGRAGSTGNSTGTHLHLTIQKTPGGLSGYVVSDVVDPAPYLGLPKTDLPGPGPATIDLLPYIRGDGRLYELRNSGGGQERLQSQPGRPGYGNEFYQTKNQQYEQFYFDNNYIYRDLDTSPGGGRYYRLKDVTVAAGSRWVPRNWFVGGVFSQARRVQFYWKNNCAPITGPPSGDVVDTMTFIARYPSYTFRTGITLPDVVQLLWQNGGERYFYARNYGLCAWERQHFDPNSPEWSAISEIHSPGSRPDNVRETGCFSP